MIIDLRVFCATRDGVPHPVSKTPWQEFRHIREFNEEKLLRVGEDALETEIRWSRRNLVEQAVSVILAESVWGEFPRLHPPGWAVVSIDGIGRHDVEDALPEVLRSLGQRTGVGERAPAGPNPRPEPARV